MHKRGNHHRASSVYHCVKGGVFLRWADNSSRHFCVHSPDTFWRLLLTYYSQRGGDSTERHPTTACVPSERTCEHDRPTKALAALVRVESEPLFFSVLYMKERSVGLLSLINRKYFDCGIPTTESTFVTIFTNSAFPPNPFR